MRPRPRRAPGIAVIALVSLALAGCAAHREAATPPPGTPPPPPTPVAILPLEELSGKAGAAEKFTRIVFTELVARGGWEVVDPGQVDGALALARLRSTGSMSRDQVRLVSDSLHVPYLITGTALEYGRVHTPDGEVPSVGLSLRLIEGRTGKVLWADQRFRSGDDKETVFGFGRESDPDRLLQLTIADLLSGLRAPVTGAAAVPPGGAASDSGTVRPKAPAADTTSHGGKP